MADRLVAWLYGTPIAVLIRGPEFRIRLEWGAEGIERWGLGSPALSVGLPIGAPAGPRDTRGLDFFENILPEGPALERMAALAGVRPADTYGILAAFGRDCAGAIMVLPDGDRPGGNAGSGYSPMTPGDLQRVIGGLDVAPLGAAPERGFRPSLAGFQRKALLGRAGDGTWQFPSGDARQRGAADAGGHAPGPARRRSGRHPQGDRGQPDRRSGRVGHPPARGVGDHNRDPGPGPRRHPGDTRRCPDPRQHPQADRADQPGLTSRPAAIVTVPRALSRLCATGECARPASHAAWRRSQPAAAR